MSRYLLLLNSASGGNQRGLAADAVRETVQRIFREAGHEISTRIIPPRALERELDQAVAAAPDAVLVAGGDGTVSTAARHLGGTPIAMGIVPLGTFNLAARDLGVPQDLRQAARFLTTAEPHAIDVLDVGGHACLCTTILGFYPEFSRFFEARDHGGRWWRKCLKVIAGAPRVFTRARPLRLTWQGPQGGGRAETKFSAFAPGRYRRTPGLMPSRTDFRAGTMTAYIGHQLGPAAALRCIADYALGRQEENPNLRVFKAESLDLRADPLKQCTLMLDGEILRMNFPIHLEILPCHLRVLTTAEMVAGFPAASESS